MAFAIDYEGCGGLSMGLSGNILGGIGDEGVEIVLRPSRAKGSSPLLPVDGWFAGLERHAYAEVVADRKDKRKGRLTLTEKGTLVRDAYDDIVVAIEQRWRRRYSGAAVHDLRSALTAASRATKRAAKG